MNIDAATIARVREALLSPDLTIGFGVGSGDTPGQGTACTIAEIKLVLTGVLDDDPHPCISEVIRRWVVRVQDAMPFSTRNSLTWREAAVGIAGSATGVDIEIKRRDLVVDWMWERLADVAVVSLIAAKERPAWDRMLTERTYDAATKATPTASGNGVCSTAVYAASVAWDRTDSYTIADAAQDAQDAAAASVTVISGNTDTNTYWKRADPAGLLVRLINLSR